MKRGRVPVGKGVEVAHGRRVEHWREQLHVVEPELGVLARGPAAGEERLERLRRELDHPVAVDPAWPAALELPVLRPEHAELHGC